MQSWAISLIEAATNVIVGYGSAVATQILMFPWFGLSATLVGHLMIGAIFTAVSLVRSHANSEGDPIQAPIAAWIKSIRGETRNIHLRHQCKA